MGKYGSIRTIAALAVVLLAPASPSAAEEYRLGNYRAPTPVRLAGAITVGSVEAQALIEARAVLPVDVMAVQRHPFTGQWLLSKPRAHLPGSVWLPNVGVGDPSPALEAWFKDQLDRLTHGSKTAGLMFYCMTDCWMSWNAAKRAVSWGYRKVHWYPEGADGWAVSGNDLVPALLPDADVPR